MRSSRSWRQLEALGYTVHVADPTAPANRKKLADYLDAVPSCRACSNPLPLPGKPGRWNTQCDGENEDGDECDAGYHDGCLSAAENKELITRACIGSALSLTPTMLLIRSATKKDRVLVAVPALEMLQQESAEVVRRRRPQQLPAVLLPASRAWYPPAGVPGRCYWVAHPDRTARLPDNFMCTGIRVEPYPGRQASYTCS